MSTKKKVKKKSVKPSPKPKAVVKVKPIAKAKPKQQALPGMEDRGIAELEDTANRLDDALEQKKEYSALANTLNDELVGLMQKYGKTEYHHKSVHIVLPPQKQKAKVTIGEFKENESTKFEPTAFQPLPDSVAVIHSEAD